MPRKKATPLSRPPELMDSPVVRLQINSGNSEERYDFNFELSREGLLRCRMSDRMMGRQVPETMSKVESRRVETLLRTLDPARIKQIQAKLARGKPKPIPPCSLIGKLEIWDGREFVQTIFMADPGQAEHAGHRIPAEVQASLQAIFSMAASATGLEGPAALQPDQQMNGGK
jgi:hypothetical protein